MIMVVIMVMMEALDVRPGGTVGENAILADPADHGET